MADTSMEILGILNHYFKLIHGATEAIQRSQKMKENEPIFDCSA